MQACVELAGYSLSETDRVRKIMGKMLFDKMKKERVIFLDGCVAQGVSRTIAAEVFDEMQAFGTYGFNKSHSYGYAMVAYWTAYLKHYYPKEFMTALFRTNASDSVIYTRESRRMGIPVQEFTPTRGNDKISRVNSVSDLFASGKIFVMV